MPLQKSYKKRKRMLISGMRTLHYEIIYIFCNNSSIFFNKHMDRQPINTKPQSFDHLLDWKENKVLQLVQKLIKPTSMEELDKDSQILKSSSKQEIEKIAKFVLILILSGHFHIFYFLDSCFIQPLLECYKDLKYKSSPPRNENSPIQSKKWRYQFISELVYTLADWFPNDLLHHQQESKYVSWIKKQKIAIKNYLLINISLIHELETIVNKLDGQGVLCLYCQLCGFRDQSTHRENQGELQESTEAKDSVKSDIRDRMRDKMRSKMLKNSKGEQSSKQIEQIPTISMMPEAQSITKVGKDIKNKLKQKLQQRSRKQQSPTITLDPVDIKQSVTLKPNSSMNLTPPNESHEQFRNQNVKPTSLQSSTDSSVGSDNRSDKMGDRIRCKLQNKKKHQI